MSLLDWILTGFLALGALAGWVFMIVYSRRWDWWGWRHDEHAAHLWLFTLSLTLIMTLYIFRPFLDRTTFAVIRAPLFVAIVVCMVWRAVLVLRAGRRRRLRR